MIFFMSSQIVVSAAADSSVSWSSCSTVIVTGRVAVGLIGIACRNWSSWRNFLICHAIFGEISPAKTLVRVRSLILSS